MAADDAPDPSDAVARSLVVFGRSQAAVRKATLDGATRLPTTDGKLDRDPAKAASLRSLVASMLRRALDALLDDTEERAVQAAADVAQGTRLDPERLDRIEAAIQRMLVEIEHVFDDGIDEVRRTIDGAVRAQQTLAFLLDELTGRIDGIFARSKTAAEAAIYAAARAALIEKTDDVAAENDEPMVYVYLGPTDGKVRPFCKAHVGKAYSKEALDRMDNGKHQPKPVSIFMGGWNCRHMPSPIPLADAIEQGFEVHR